MEYKFSSCIVASFCNVRLQKSSIRPEPAWNLLGDSSSNFGRLLLLLPPEILTSSIPVESFATRQDQST